MGRSPLFTLESAAHWCCPGPGSFCPLGCPYLALANFPMSQVGLPGQSGLQASLFKPAERVRTSWSIMSQPLCPLSDHDSCLGLMASGHSFPDFPNGQNYLQLLLQIQLLACPLEIVIQRVLEGGLRRGRCHQGIHSSEIGVGKLNILSTAELRSSLALVFQPVHGAWLEFGFLN